MKAIYDRALALGEGLASIRAQFQLPGPFSPEVEEAAAEAARRPLLDHVDRTGVAFVTLDPLSSTDLDQAFWIERSGGDLVLRYAIADIGWFVADSGPVDAAAWARGETIYMPDGKISLYPPILCEGAASLLPDGDRPAIILIVRISAEGSSKLDGAERAVIRSRAKLGYSTVRPEDLPPEFSELSRRIEAAGRARGASRIDPPQQEVIEQPDGSFSLEFRPVSAPEEANAGLSLAANLAVADAMCSHATGLFRIMPDPDKHALRRLHHSAVALGVDWPSSKSLEDFERNLDPNVARHAAFMLAIRRAGAHASYAPYRAGERPWHAAMKATYAHATAPLRRLADRYVLEAALQIANGRAVPENVGTAFGRLPDVMNRAEARAAQVDAAVHELAEAVVLQGRVGETFKGIVTDIDERGARIQLCDPAVITRIPANGLGIGQAVRLKLLESDPERRLTRFAPVSQPEPEASRRSEHPLSDVG